jgi:hypothetical protein
MDPDHRSKGATFLFLSSRIAVAALENEWHNAQPVLLTKYPESIGSTFEGACSKRWFV